MQTREVVTFDLNADTSQRDVATTTESPQSRTKVDPRELMQELPELQV